MKTAISIDDQTFNDAERAAKELGLTRSGLYTRAIQEFIRNHMPDSVTAKYNEAYGGAEPDMVLENAAVEFLSKVEW